MVFVRGEKGKIMAEMISKWEVVGNLIALENEYQFHKDEWDAQMLYRKICELEMEIGKRTALDLVRCKDCKHKGWIQEPCHGKSVDYCRVLDFCINNTEKCFCYYGERKDNEID